MTPCEWPISYTACTSGCSALEDMSNEDRARVERMATDFLWNVTNRVYGTCEVAIRPCSEECAGDFGSTFWGRHWFPGGRPNGWLPIVIDDFLYNTGCGCGARCNCLIDGAKSLIVPGPLAEVVSVRIEGAVIPASEYKVTYNRYITLSGDRRWPACQNLNLEATEEGTFEIVYKRGVPVPEGGQLAAGILACELAKALCGDNDCQLPRRVQTITRQGITVGFQDMFEGLDEGKTGIWIIDSWITSTRRPGDRAGVRSPDIRKSSVGSTPWRR